MQTQHTLRGYASQALRGTSTSHVIHTVRKVLTTPLANEDSKVKEIEFGAHAHTLLVSFRIEIYTYVSCHP